MLEDLFKARLPRFNIENRLPVARPGLPFICGLAMLAAALWCLGFGCLAAAAAFLTLFVCWFFRDPKRPTPPGSFGLSPCDGTVIRVDPESACPLTGEPALKVSVFMDLFSVHVNRAPVSGRLIRQDYYKGAFVIASFDKASENNERNAIIIADQSGRKVTVVQIAGLVARRIVSWVQTGETLARGQRFGMIRFGSRVDLYLPREAEIMVALGQKVQAGWSPVWRLEG
jgi:phosphatidylserine decarboxylase